MNLPVRDGDVVGGKYVVERLLGRGGMGAVFVATQRQLGRSVAIKFLLRGVASNDEALARFQREAMAAASLTSDHVSKVYDVGSLEDGSPYIVMELLEGEDFAAILEQTGPLPFDLATKAIVEACDAIGEAHARGIVHRDLKPANLFLSRRANGTQITKVLDFGISKIGAGAVGVALTSASALMGSALYMSPEQFRDVRSVDGRTDIWALGATLYQLLTGVTPFEATEFGEVCARVLTADPLPIRSLRPDVPRSLEAVVMRCLVKDPAGRFPTTNDLVLAIRDAAADPSVSQPFASGVAPTVASVAGPARSQANPPGVSGTVTAVSSSFLGRQSGDKRPRWRPIALGGAAFLAAVVVAVSIKTIAPHESHSLIAPSAPSLTAALPPIPLDPPIATPLATVLLPEIPLENPAEMPSKKPAAVHDASPAPPPTPRHRTAPALVPAAQVTPPPPAPTPPSASCDPAFTLDANGGKHWKPECFGAASK